MRITGKSLDVYSYGCTLRRVQDVQVDMVLLYVIYVTGIVNVVEDAPI